MADQRIQYTEQMVGAGHPSLSDTLNRLALVEHNTDGTHKSINATGNLIVSGTGPHAIGGATSAAATLNLAGGQAVTGTDGATLRIGAASTGATNNYGLWVDAGLSRFDGGLAYTTNSAYDVGRLGARYHSVTTSPVEIAVTHNARGGGMTVVAGADSGNPSKAFVDVVVWLYGVAAVANWGGKDTGSPSARTYAVTDGSLYLTMASGTYNVSATNLSVSPY